MIDPAEHCFFHEYPRGGENKMPAHRLDMRLFKEVLRLELTARLSHRQLAVALRIGVGSVSNYLAAFEHTQFCVRYRRWVKRLKLSMRQTHQPGEKMFVDYRHLNASLFSGVSPSFISSIEPCKQNERLVTSGQTDGITA